MRRKPDARESAFGLGICLLGNVLGAALSWWGEGFLPIYAFAAIGLICALPLRVKHRPWPLLLPALAMVLWGVAAAFIPLVGGASLLALLHAPIAMTIIIGTVLVFDAAW
jgi:hypothetical protein